jgi:hypothetical protein
MAEMITLASKFMSNDIKYTSPKANASGGKSINILNKTTNSALRLSTPLMLTWGASDYVDQNGQGNGKYEMSLQFPNDEYKNDDTDLFLKNMKDMEEKIKADALTYSKEWFGKKHPNAEVINALWTPMLKYSKDKQTGDYDMSKPPRLVIKLPLWEGVWRCEIYDVDQQRLYPDVSNPGVSPIDLLVKGSNVAVIIQCGGLWFANGKFGITWKLSQAVVQRKQSFALNGQCLIQLNSSDKEKLKKTPVTDSSLDVDMTSKVTVEDSDEEVEVEDEDQEEDDDEVEEEDDAPQPEPEPVVEVVLPPPAPAPVVQAIEPTTVKKRVVKKKATV